MAYYGTWQDRMSWYHVAPIAGMGALVVLGLIVVQSVRSDDEPQQVVPAEVSTAPLLARTTEAATSSTTADNAIATSAPSTDTGAASGALAGASAVSAVTASSAAPSSTVATTTATTATTSAPTTTVAPTTTLAPATPTTLAQVATPHSTLPDGSPEPVIAIFDLTQITLTGAVPTAADVERLAGLALANSKTPATIVNNLTTNPAIPRNVGVRVIELNSARFPDGSSEVLLAHAAELNRVVTIMNALPNITVLAIGHADQRGDENANFALSAERARSVVNYLVSQGISASRVASRAVGEADLLTLGDTAAALALNRRTEFVFYGLLQP